jgi:RHS repeat-associated protein
MLLSGFMLCLKHKIYDRLDNYRAGNTETSVACAVEEGSCKWVSLDPSFKLKVYKDTYKSLLKNLSFNYGAYYNAENPSSPEYVQGLKNKNPLEIFEEQAMEYLRVNYPSVTLEDVIDQGVIVKDESGLLPASLPYEVVGNVARYDSVSDHDTQAGNVAWTKYLTSTMRLPGCSAIGLPSYTVSLAELSIKQLTLTMFEDNGTKIFAHRLDNTQVGSSISASGSITFICNGVSTVVEIGTPMGVEVSIEAAPGDDPITVKYENLTFGGYYLIASGGETSNWTQVKRAYNKLLAANEQYPIVVDTDGTIGVAGTAYVDMNANGSADAGDTKLLDDLAAQDALTGGLLYVAQAVYYTRLREESQRYSRLKGIISPIAAYVGIVSATHEVEYLNDVPFAVTPGGLLIDLKGIRINGSWETDMPETYSNETFKFLGHLASSLEHEVWQEITGYDAISTMRGIQLSLGSGDELLDVDNNTPSSNTFPAALSSLGFDNVAPVDFTPHRHQLFGRDLQTWAYTGTDTSAGFNVFRADVSDIPAYDSRALWLSYSGNSELDGFVSYMDSVENQLITLSAGDGQLKTAVPFTVSGTAAYSFASMSVSSPSGFSVNRFYKNANNLLVVEINETAQHTDGVYPLDVGFYAVLNGSLVSGSLRLDLNVSDPTYGYTCGATSIGYYGTATQLLGDLETCFNDTVAQAGITQSIDFLDANKGFSLDGLAFRPFALNINDYELGFIQEMRSHMYYVVDPSARYQYVLPARLSQGPNYLFSVYIKNGYVNDQLSSSTYAIVNYSNRLIAGGGYVTAEETINPSTNSDFNNEVFTDLNLVSATNNDVVRTPSTADPVSTVTGNMYHDETDMVISGRGLNYVFTRTYNSDQVKTTTASEFPLSKGWTHSYNMRLIANDYGKNPNFAVAQAPENENGKTSSITYVDERGGELNYLVDDINDTWAITSPRMSFDQLELDVPAAGSYTLTFRNGVKYVFNGSDLRVPGNIAKLSRIEDPYGNQLNFSYNASGQLSSITDNTGVPGRSGLTLTYYPAGDIDEGHLSTITDWTGRSWSYAFSNGQLTCVTDPLGHAMTYTYVPGTDLLRDIVSPQVRNGKKKTTTFSYYENDQAYSYIDQLGNAESLTYDLFRKRTRITNPSGFITEHYYDENGAMIKLVEPDKAILQFANNADGLRYMKRDAQGYATTYSYNLARTLDGAATDTYGQVTREQDAFGYTVDYTYGIYDQVTVIKNKNNIETVNEYYATTDISNGALKGKLHRVIMPVWTWGGYHLTNVVLAEYRYYQDGTVKSIEEPISNDRVPVKRITDFSYAYDSNGKTVTKIVRSNASGISMLTTEQHDNLWRLTSSSVRRRASATDSTILTLTTAYEYDSLGRQVKVIDPLNNIKETVYDANGNVIQVINRFALGNPGVNTRALHDGCSVDALYPNHHSCVVSTRSYDLADRLIVEYDLNGNSIRYQYDPMGNVTKVTNKRGYGLNNDYDAMGRLTRIADENGHSIKTDYDLAGRVVAITDPNGNNTRFTYDVLGRKASVTTPEQRVTRFEYDGNGNVVKQTDANGVSGKQPLNSQNSSLYKEYDEFNRVVLELNANNEQTRYTYNLLGKLTSVTDAKGQSTWFGYDGFGHITGVFDPLVETPVDKRVAYTYDEMGNRLTNTDRNGEITRTTYDKLNRPILIEYLADGTAITLRYNQYGELDQIANAAVTYDYLYDNQHRMTQKRDSRNGLTLQWAYDVAGNMVSKVDYQGQVTTFTYDDSNRLVAMAKAGMLEASYHYDGAGRLLSRILSNGSATLYQYDKDGMLIKLSQRSADGTIIDERVYTRDDVGNITGVSVAGGEVVQYSYDPVYRLTTVTSSVPGNNISYTYDSVGNRTSKTDSTGSYHYVYNNSGNRLDEVRVGSVTGSIRYSFEYDGNGSRTAKKDDSGAVVESYLYDQRRLISSITTGSVTTSFAYDPNAYRIQKKSGANENNYFLEAEHLEAVYDETGTLKATYLRGVVVDEIIGGLEKDMSGDMRYQSYHHDQVNSVTALTDHNGQTIQSRSYTPFGMDAAVSGESNNALSYTGRERDANSLYYYRARYYDPEMGRFLSEDSLGFEAGINFYAYVNNNPLSFNDPTGMDYVGIDANLSVLTGVHGGIHIDTDTGDIYLNGGGGFGGGVGLSFTVTPDVPPTGYTVNYNGSLCMAITCGSYGGTLIPIEGTNRFENKFGGTVSTPLDPIFGSDTFEMTAKVGADVNFDINGSVINVYDAWDNVAQSVSNGYDNVIDYLGLGEATQSPSAAGGFVLYPGKTNTNMARSVYRK